MSSKEQQAKEKRILKGVKEILEFRGYNIKKTNEDDDYLDVLADKLKEEGEKIRVIARFPKNPQIGVKTIRILGKLQEDEEIDDALLISEAPLTHYAKKESVKLGIEIISSSNPLFNIFEHNQVPLHLKLKSNEIKSFLSNYQIEKHQIPKILESDPAVKAIQANPGDVIKIVRNPLMGEHGAYYRVVIKSTSRLRLAEPISIKKPISKTKKDKKKEKPEKTTTKKEAPKKTTTKPKVTTKKVTPKKTTTKQKKTSAKKTTTTKSKSTAK